MRRSTQLRTGGLELQLISKELAPRNVSISVTIQLLSVGSCLFRVRIASGAHDSEMSSESLGARERRFLSFETSAGRDTWQNQPESRDFSDPAVEGPKDRRMHFGSGHQSSAIQISGNSLVTRKPSLTV